MDSSVASNRRVVSVFGGSRAAEDSADYREAYLLGGLLAGQGYTLCNGGYHGTMAAAARGAKDAGGRTIGITVELLERLTPNPWIDEEVGTATLFARLEQLATLGDAYVALRGGIGTLLELALVWNLAQLQTGPPRPIVTVGRGWRAVLRALPRYLAVRSDDLAMIVMAPSPRAAVRYLSRHFAEPTRPA
jgi:uncharacterized protein (TIGR00730 family)